MSSAQSRSERQVRKLSEEGFRSAEVARRAGVSRAFVRSILGPSPEQRGRPMLDGPLSPLHKAVGNRVFGFFTEFVTNPSLDMKADHFQWSSRKQGQIERGTWDFTLSDLQLLSDKMNVSICELIGGKK